MSTNNPRKLATAYCRQSIDIKNNMWIVFDSESNTPIAELPHANTPKEAMSYLHFARQFEASAFDEGIKFGQARIIEEANAKINALDQLVAALKIENEGLATNLEQHIIGG